MRIVCISDTHGQHDKLVLPKGDVLIHAGDFTQHGSRIDAIDFVIWLGEQDFKHKLVVAGNHDFCAEERSSEIAKMIRDAGGIYLQDSGCVIEGHLFYGSPWTPKFFNWAFMKDRGKPISAMWDKIPDMTEVLITHGPPRGILDVAQSQPHAGCDDLLKRVKELPILKLHVFGHLHEGYGTHKWIDPKHPVTFVNAAQLNDFYQMVHEPIVVEI